ncbi:hypothetical protein U1Q18_002108, partial [Sarracenia purpurea var. burkii]
GFKVLALGLSAETQVPLLTTDRTVMIMGAVSRAFHALPLPICCNFVLRTFQTLFFLSKTVW